MQVTAYFLGGTISMTGATSPGRGATPALGAAELVANLDLGDGVDLTVVDFRRVSSARLTFADLLALLGEARAAVEAGTDGVVVVQGTDVLEETAYVLDLLWDRPEPLVMTGAMRLPTTLGADGPANLAAAVTVAADAACRDLGVLVALDDDVHAARWVAKRHSSATGAFTSEGPGPVASLHEGRVVVRVRVDRRPALPTPGAVGVHVGLVTAVFDDDPRRYRAAAEHADGLVVAGLGAGHVNPDVAEALGDLAQRMPVVLVTRTGAGSVHRHSYGGPGSEEDLLARGLVHGGYLGPLRARLLLTLVLAGGADRDEVVATAACHGTG